MGYAGKSSLTTHEAHYEALKGLNLYDCANIDQVFKILDKSHFCQAKYKDGKPQSVYTLDPQPTSHGQVLTSTVMHAISLQKLKPFFKE